MAVLVAYASALGSTREVAEHIASRLSGAAGEVVCRSVEEITAVSGYDAVILGSAVHNQAWLPAALLFARRHCGNLASVPVWAFSVGMVDGLPKPFRRRGGALQQKRLVEALRSQIRLRGHKLFSGAYQSSHMPPMLRGLFRLAGGRFGDLRDWDAVDQWVDQIMEQLTTPRAADPPASPADPPAGSRRDLSP